MHTRTAAHADFHHVALPGAIRAAACCLQALLLPSLLCMRAVERSQASEAVLNKWFAAPSIATLAAWRRALAGRICE